ncbi:hypothetical protein [uncultured Mucilaginibacter sp.]|uniref:hypothetical protein n=1 Tax=uncultured Mucilaginibacter sp. TaxID=797541 RepID=UPI0026109791|nr:hypothetical protein [uncultured Mucilaginibacter sp.]
MKTKFFNSTILVVLFSVFVTSCKKENNDEKIASKTKTTFDKSEVIKNVVVFSNV